MWRYQLLLDKSEHFGSGSLVVTIKATKLLEFQYWFWLFPAGIENTIQVTPLGVNERGWRQSSEWAQKNLKVIYLIFCLSIHHTHPSVTLWASQTAIFLCKSGWLQYTVLYGTQCGPCWRQRDFHGSSSWGRKEIENEM